MMHMRLMVSGSAALPVPTMRRWATVSGHVLLERYGMTEVGMVLSNPIDMAHRVPGSVGRPLPGVEVQVVVTDDSGDRPAAPGEAGELRVRGAAVFREYWRRPDATRDAFDAEGFFKTGDCVQVGGDAAFVTRLREAHHDALTAALATRQHVLGTPSMLPLPEADYDAQYRILGRNSVDILKSGGYKISALDVENVLLECAHVEECAVVGVPDEEWGERVAACVVLSDESSDLTLEDLRAFAKARVATYKAPSLLKIVAALPRNPMGKVDKRAVVALFST